MDLPPLVIKHCPRAKQYLSGTLTPSEANNLNNPYMQGQIYSTEVLQDQLERYSRSKLQARGSLTPHLR